MPPAATLETVTTAARLAVALSKAIIAKDDLSSAALAQGGLKAPEQGNPKPFDTRFQGIPIRVDRPKGFKQVGKSEDGKPWERTYLVDYGYVPGVKALLTPKVTDEEDLDVFLGPNADAPNAHVVLQIKTSGEPDELKVMLGYDTPAAARKMYLAHVPARHFGGLATMPIEMFKALLGLETIEASKALGALASVLWSGGRGERTAKAMGASFEEVNRALREKLADLYPAKDEHGCYLYICDTFDEFVVFEVEGRLLRVGYTYEGGVASLVGTPVQVTRTYVPVGETTEKTARLLVTKAAAAPPAGGPEERFVLGIVLEPEVVDGQGDIYSAAEIKATAYEYMRNFRNVGLMHKGLVNGKVFLVQSFLAPTDMEVEGTKIRKGTWLIGLEVPDDELWGKIKSGDLTGLSIGGFAKRTPVAS